MENEKAFRPIPGLSREEEEKQLAEIISIAQNNLTRTEGYISQLSDELHDLMEAYETKDKEGLSLLHNAQSQLQEYGRDLLRCQKARQKPYFGRIDFKDPKQPQEESYYVGRVGISREGSRPVVIDWRAPVASVYYENSIGPCSYTVKNEGTYEIDLKRKRTYEIAEGRLKDFFDSDVVANDELLNKYLAKSKKAVLGEIIATIQKEQNGIIRKSPMTNLIVQGVAGSGKTTVAMHRISYILYNYGNRFRPEDFYIIGSNRILLNYITSVLPDLDVYGVRQMTMEQLFVRLLYEDWDPKIHQIRPIDKKNPYASMKGGYEWFHDLEQFCREYESGVIPQEDICLEKENVLLIERKMICHYLENNPQMSMQNKINMLNEILLSKLENELSAPHAYYTQEEKKELYRRCRRHFGRAAWKGSVFEVYQSFLKAQELSGKVIPSVENAFDVYDLAALAYLYKRIKETDGVREATHVIIDEAQDFGMMAYGALAYCLRGCTYTIMGDVSQNIHFGYGLNDWKELQELILTGAFDGFGLLKKSYRNTVEISDFATEILRHGSFSIYPVEPISRHGNPVRVTECRDNESMLQETIKTIEGWQRDGHETIAVICRDEAEAAQISGCLEESLSLVDSNMETTEFGTGIMVLPVEYTKGLEFDAVLIYHPSEEHYPAEDSYVKLLYVAATRALHELTVVHLGDLTDLIRKPVSDEKRMRSLENQVLKESQRHTMEIKPDMKKERAKKEQELQNVLQGARARAQQAGIKIRPAAEQEARAQAQQAGTGVRARPEAEQEAPAQAQQAGRGIRVRPAAEQKAKRERSVRTANNTVSINPSPYHFWDVPDSALLRPKGHSRIDNSVRIVRKTKRFIDLISSYGTLRLTPLEDGMIRVQFRREAMAAFHPGHWNYEPEAPVSWTAREGKALVEVAAGRLRVRIDKGTGALLFLNQKGDILLAEKGTLPRQMETDGAGQSWVYFDWPKNEKLSAKGILADDLERMNQKARYISFGGKKQRMPLLFSEYGYGIGAAAGPTVMCCAIPMYGTYLYTEGDDQIDYYFLYGENYGAILELYQKL
ncbi:MAG: 3'-5' exonuclease [Lachnospiraceae bacterium]|nr:3'-5' exonuclease [Lachnospiraceae bacterium]